MAAKLLAGAGSDVVFSCLLHGQSTKQSFKRENVGARFFAPLSHLKKPHIMTTVRPLPRASGTSSSSVRASSLTNQSLHSAFSANGVPVEAREVMNSVLEALLSPLRDELLPTRTPEGVQAFASEDGKSHGSIILQAGVDRDKVDRVLASWLTLSVPQGSLSFATVTILMGTASDCPHFNVELILTPASESSPAKVTFVMDLTPRRDLVLHSDYLARVYGETRLKDIFKECEKDSRLQRYPIDNLVIRAALSPTALVYSVLPPDKAFGRRSEEETDPQWRGSGENLMGLVQPVAVEVAGIWADVFASRAKEVEEAVREEMAKRDAVIRVTGTESVLGGALAMAFGRGKSDEILAAYRNP